MRIFCFGANHTAPAPVLERLAHAAESTARQFNEMIAGGEVSEAMLLSATRRTEFYLVATEPTGAREALIGRLRRAGLDDAGLKHTYTHREEGAVRHLMRVAAGIDSPVAGEMEILGHIREAHERALNDGTAKEQMSTLASRAMEFGTRLRDDPELARLYLSVPIVAVRIAFKVFGSLSEKSLLLVGDGETGRSVARQLSLRGLRGITVCSAQQAARELGAATTDDLHRAATEADMILWATEELPSAELRKAIGGARKTKVVFDFGEFGSVHGGEVFVFHREALEAEARKTRQGDDASLERVEDLLSEEVERFRRWQNAAEVERLRASLQLNVERIRRQQIERYGKNLTEEQSRELEAFTTQLLQSILGDLTSNFGQIKLDTDMGAKEYNLIRELFNIRPEQQDE